MTNEAEGGTAEKKPTVKRAAKPDKVVTTAQRLGSLVKSARDIMRKDKGLNGDLDRLPMLTWVMFLKFMDDHEQEREMFADEKGYIPVIEAPYRWRDWAASDTGLSGDDLLEFLSNQQARLPNGEEGQGLFPYLRTLAGSDIPQRNTVGNIFQTMQNRMANGYLLRSVVNLVDNIHFDSSDEIHTLGNLYESMLKEMRDAAGDSGEFYTPRPVVQVMVKILDPKLGEVVFDPACGTGGFLVEAFKHLQAQCQTVEDRHVLQDGSIIGGEAKGLPYLLAQMNLLLHEVESPRITPDNSLNVNLTEIGDRERVDIILTNPPFGGEEERSIQNNFPVGLRTSETAFLFLQLIMRKLKRGDAPGRAGVVVPNGTLFADGVAAKIKESLLTEFNLHTIVRLPNGIFAPYTPIPTNLLFFDRSGPTTDIWYYEQPLPEGRKNYTKTAPVQLEEFAPLVEWWNNREENERVWKVDFKAKYADARAKAQPHWDAARQAEEDALQHGRTAKELTEKIDQMQKHLQKSPNLLSLSFAERDTLTKEVDSLRQMVSGIRADEQTCLQRAKEEQAAGDAIYWPIFNLDSKNPNAAEDFAHLPPEQLVADIMAKERRILELMEEIQMALAGGVK